MDLTIILQLYSPIVSAIFFLIMLFAVRISGSDNDMRLSISPFGFLSFLKILDSTKIVNFTLEIKTRISNILIIRMVLFILVIISLMTYLAYDYSKFFPQHLNMEVFFDNEGIRKSLEAYSEAEIHDLNIADNYEQFQDKYYKAIDGTLEKVFPGINFFNVKESIREGIHSKGEVKFIVKKNKGSQSYHIEQSEGSLTHTLERPKLKPIFFKSFFEKKISPNDHISPSLVDIYIKHSVIMKPRFKQILAEDIKSDGVLFDHIVYGVTKINFMPYPKYENTIYLYKAKDVEGLIPVGYAVYTEK